MRRKLQRNPRFRASAISVDRPQQFADMPRIDDRGAVGYPRDEQGTTEHLCMIMLGAKGRNCISEYPSGEAAGTDGGFMVAAALDRL